MTDSGEGDDGYPFDYDGPPVYSPDMGDTIYISPQLQDALRDFEGLPPLEGDDE